MTANIAAKCDDVYYQGHYWNNFDLVWRELNRRVSGDPNVRWFEYFHKNTGRRLFKKALILNCGNGWVERDILQICPIFEQAVGIDYSARLLDEARRANEGLPIRYYQADINDAHFFEDGFDLVINHAACHHIAYIDRVMKAICSALPEDGYLLALDYVGPHRNQYPYDHWSKSWKLNNTLPEHLRKEMKYPHLKTMLAIDPTEAIHSELILDTTARYFNFVDHKHLGGGLAYEILCFNQGLINVEPKQRDEWIQYVMDEDLAFTNSTASYFDYYACTPNKQALASPLANKFTEEENRRELAALQNGGLYYEQTLLQHLYERLANQ
jgi:SAM-dependent methyltransferase